MTTTLAAPYTAADHATSMSCSPRSVTPTCGASSSADRSDGALTASAWSDSGLDGSLPADVDSSAMAEITPTIPIGEATGATLTFHVHVTGARSAESGAGRGNAYLWADADCDGCVQDAEQGTALLGPGDESIAVTLVPGAPGAHTVNTALTIAADADIECDDFCIIPPSGTASASASAVVTGVEVQLWGVGEPSRPTIETPAPNSSVSHSTYQKPCDPTCGEVVGEEIAGTAEPGMPVTVREGAQVLSHVTAGATGAWVVYVTLPPGRQVVTATADGPGGTSVSAPRPFIVSGA